MTRARPGQLLAGSRISQEGQGRQNRSPRGRDDYSNRTRCNPEVPSVRCNVGIEKGAYGT